MPRQLIALLVVLSGACTVKHAQSADSTSTFDAGPTQMDSSGGVDSLTGVSPRPSAPAPRWVPGDTTSIIASDTELRELAANLTIPVAGVRVGDLHDTYNEARGGRVHQALDILAPRNTPVLAATDGRVLKLHQSVAGGIMVYAADASDRFVMMYGHLERYADGLTAGAPLRRGQVIGYVGTSGNAPANTPHLHFAIARGRPSVAWWRGTPVNPYPLLAGTSAGR